MAAEGKSRDEIAAELEDRRLPLPDAELALIKKRMEAHRRRRFSFAESLLLTAIVCAGLAVSTYFPVHIFAGVLGFTLLISLLLLPRWTQFTRVAWCGWWMLVLIYAGAAILAVFGGILP